MEDLNDATNQITGKLSSAVVNRKPALLAMILVDILKENGWSPDDIHFLGSEIINESGILL